ncbi:uroporphyrinogen-III C-methyltransferase [Methylomagnum sp.]
MTSATEDAAEPARPPVEPAIADKPAAPSKPKKTRSMAWVGYVVLLAVMAISVGGFFLLQELRSRQEGLGGQITNKDQQLLEVTRQMNAMQSEMATLHSQMATVQTQVSTEDSKFERSLGEHAARLSDRLEATRNELGNDVQHIQRQLNKSRGDLMVADAEYLLSIANQKLHLIGDVKSVLAAMEAADQRLHDSGDPAVFKVREALAEEIDVLKKMNAPDVVGISSKLLTLEKKVKNVPLFLPHADDAKEHATKPGSDSPSENEGDVEEKDPLDSALKDLKGLVTVRRTDRPIEAVLTPAEAEGIRQILLLKLEATRTALLRGDETLYKDSLTSANEWLGEHFEADAPETKELRSELGALQNQSIAVPFPDISKSLSLLRNIERLRLEAEEAEAKKSGAKAPSAEPPAAPQQEMRPDSDQGVKQ